MATSRSDEDASRVSILTKIGAAFRVVISVQLQLMNGSEESEGGGRHVVLPEVCHNRPAAALRPRGRSVRCVQP